MPAQYPLPVFHFTVQWRGTYFGFSEVTGLTQETQAIEYRDSTFPEPSSIKMPRPPKVKTIALKRGMVKGDNEFARWLATVQPNPVQRRDLIVRLFYEEHHPATIWKVHNAFPVKVEGPKLEANGNEIAIASIELAHEGLEVQKDA